ncbi:plasmid pRiA4b ORF-3 family protein [Roseimaritima ulvae]|uniref:Plasmid pRiA4b ORF-3-like protein n=1 Tax=Roseimaritima ulvae TaxID=980254 RepID=A0A5B9R396_9BACT|nr:plasmid pRiA4b ORF-3 family protein [Roseimaritima ulvae]QEG40793.1 Plasmid pRiA4b ORF-3-like protein [Roseimaritima ulvae]
MNELTKAAIKKILERQSFEPGRPGPILLNTEALMDALATGVPTTSKYFALPIRCLAELNERLETPIAHKMKRPQLKSFPTLAGLFLLLRASGLAIGETKPKRVVLIDPEMREKWNDLNSTEQYMSLVDTWWTRVNWTILGERDRFGGQMRADTRDLYYQLSRQANTVIVDSFNTFYRYETRVAAALLEQFGWIKVAYASQAEEGKIAEMQSVETTEFGDAMFQTLDGIVDSRIRNESAVQKELKSLVPAWKNSLLPAERRFREGRYKLKLSWLKVWRQLETPATTSLADVTALLLAAFDFDQDHLYQLEYRDASGREVLVVDPQYGDGDLLADEVQLGEVPLDEGDSMELLFDFGDCWRFTITIESVDESDTDNFEPVITASKGEAPEQYGFDDY